MSEAFLEDLCVVGAGKVWEFGDLLRGCEIRLTPAVTECSEERSYVSYSVRDSDWYMYHLPQLYFAKTL